MAKTFVNKPLGFLLQKAGLVSSEQINIALKDQSHLRNRKIGEILAIRGWIKPETADFFAEEWPKILKQKPRQPLGQYFKAAALMDEQQIAGILAEQRRIGLKFGTLAVLEGLIEQKTLDFFLEELDISKRDDTSVDKLSPVKSNKSQHLASIKNHLLHNKKCEPVVLLKLYQQIWQQGQILTTGTAEEIELINSGLIVRDNHQVKIAKPIYQSVFNQSWIEQELARLEPYSQIHLKLSGLDKKASLPYKVLTEVRFWTGNEPFLTQKLYQLIRAREFFIPKGKEAEIIENLVQTQIIDNWENQIAAEHLKAIRDRLIHNNQCSPLKLLKAYKKIWQHREIAADGSAEQAQLLTLGLIREQQGKVIVSNQIYQSVFNQSWIDKHLAMLVQPLKTDETPKKEQVPQVIIKEKPAQINQGTKILLAILGLLGLSSIGLFVFNLLAQKQEVQLFYQANQLLQQQEYDEALEAYNRILKINASYYQAWTNRGYALAGLKQYEEMLESCKSATVIQPKAEYAWNCQGEALHNLKKYSEAITAFETAIAINPQEPIFWMNKGESLNKSQRADEALLDLSEALDLLQNQAKIEGIEAIKDKFKIAFYQQGQALLKLKLYSQALQAHEQALKHEKNYLPAQWGKAIALHKSGHYTEARELFNQILQRNDLSREQKAITWFYIGLYLCETGQVTGGIDALETALQLKPDYQAAKEALDRCN
jgi:tetratricopeptide (TPR) repeat protein